MSVPVALKDDKMAVEGPADKYVPKWKRGRTKQGISKGEFPGGAGKNPFNPLTGAISAN